MSLVVQQNKSNSYRYLGKDREGIAEKTRRGQSRNLEKKKTDVKSRRDIKAYVNRCPERTFSMKGTKKKTKKTAGGRLRASSREIGRGGNQ